MMENRIPSLKCDSDVFVTFEGDNMVMLQVNSCQTPRLKADESTRYMFKPLKKSSRPHAIFKQPLIERPKRKKAYITRLAWQTYFA